MSYVIINGGSLTGFQRKGGARGMRDRPGPNFGPTLGPFTGVFREPYRDPARDTDGPVNGLGALAGPLKLTIEHLGDGRAGSQGRYVCGPGGCVRTLGNAVGPSAVDRAWLQRAGGLAGVGGVGALGALDDSTARDQIGSAAIDTLQQWVDTLQSAINAVPVAAPGVVANLTARSRLQTALSEIPNQVQPAVLAVVFDTSVALSDVRGRVTQFLQSYADDLKGQMAAINAGVQANTLQGQLNAFGQAMAQVLASLGKNIGNPLVQTLPPWVAPLAVAVALAYVAHVFKEG